jgi:hypothetical protein
MSEELGGIGGGVGDLCCFSNDPIRPPLPGPVALSGVHAPHNFLGSPPLHVGMQGLPLLSLAQRLGRHTQEFVIGSHHSEF